MKRSISGLLFLLAAGCSAASGPEPDASASAAADAVAATTAAKPEEAPLTAEKCIEEAKGSGNRAEIARPCHESACEQGNARACEILKSYDGFAAPGGSGEDSGAGDTDQEP